MGIINFRGKRDKAISKPAEQILVSDYMTKKLITFKPSDSLDHVINLLIKNKISGGPVVNDKNGKLCNVTLGPCSTPEKETEYKCPVRGVDFVDDDEWKDKVNIWFQTRFEIAKQFAVLSVEWKGKKITLEEALAPLTDPKTVSENPHLVELSAQVAELSNETDKIAEKTEEEVDQHLQDAQKQMEEHNKAMEEVDKIVSSTTPEEEEQKIGGKKSRKKRRTKKRKSIRRKKAKKTKKH